MYPISSTVLDLLRKSSELHITMTVSPVSGSQFTITESDIVQGSLSLDRYCVAGEAIEIGSVCSSELKFNLDNYDGRYNNVRFEGAEIYPVLNVKEPGGTTNNYIPLGYFTVDVLPRKLSTIQISALDHMMHFQKRYNNTLVYPATIREIIQNACTACNVTISTILTSLYNYNYTVESAPTGEGITYRDILRWCGEITGSCAYMDWTGQLRLEWYHYPEFEILVGDRFTHDINETDMKISKIQVVNGEETTVIGETTGNYVISIVGNQLMQGNLNSLIYSHVLGTTYRPYSCPTLGFPHLYPLDRAIYVDKDGNRIQTIITHVNWKLHGRTTLQGKGISETKSGYAAVNSLTDMERNIISGMVQSAVGDIDPSGLNEQLTQMEQATLLLNQMMFASLGLYFTTIEGSDGDRYVYAHDKPTLAASSTIYTMRGGGFAYTNTGWNNGNPVWLYGFTSDGNAVYKALSVYRLSDDLITAGTMSAARIKGDTLTLGGANNTMF